MPLLDRLIEYYVQYSHNVITYEWVRIFLFAGLRGEDLNRRFVEYIRERVSTRVVKEIRAELNLPTEDDYPISDLEFELGGVGLQHVVHARSRLAPAMTTRETANF